MGAEWRVLSVWRARTQRASQAPMSAGWSGVSASARSVAGTSSSVKAPAEGDPVGYDPVDETWEEAKPRLLASKVWRCA